MCQKKSVSKNVILSHFLSHAKTYDLESSTLKTPLCFYRAFFFRKKVQEKLRSLELTNFRRHHIILVSKVKEVVAQWLERRPVTSKVAGSSPVNLVPIGIILSCLRFHVLNMPTFVAVLGVLRKNLY